jgi:hypothetical protein
MSEIKFQSSWFTAPTSCTICLLYYTKKKPVKLHDAKALESHLDGHVHRTAVNQLLVTHSTHSKIKAAALNQKPRKGVKVNLPASNNNFWKYALLQQPTQLSAPSTSTPTPELPSTVSTTSTPTIPSRKRQRTSENKSQPSVSSASVNETTLVTLVKHGNRIDDIDKRLMSIEGVIHNLDMILRRYGLQPVADTQSSSPIAASAPTVTEIDVYDDYDDVPPVSEHEQQGDMSDNELTTTTSSHTPLQRTASAPVTMSSTSKRNKRTRTPGAVPASKNTRSHLRR